MRNFLLTTCLTFSLSTLLAQVPQAIKYQAVARDTTGSIMANANITVRVSILDSAAGGGVVYSEIHKTGTNKFGLFSISIGRGIQPSGLFANINWATGSKWMQLEMSQNDGATFTLIGASEMLSVPYAMVAGTSLNCVHRPDTAKLDYPEVRYWTPTTRECCFDPEYPDGTDGMRGITKLITDSTSYVVPAGYNLHILQFTGTTRLTYTGEQPVINGIRLSNEVSRTSLIILGPGDSITSYSSNYSFLISGYLIKPRVLPIQINLNDSSYVVPSGKQLFVTYGSNWNSFSQNIYVNGLSFGWYLSNELPLILNSGDSLSFYPTTTHDIYLNGYLK